jgi:Methyltransferase domain
MYYSCRKRNNFFLSYLIVIIIIIIIYLRYPNDYPNNQQQQIQQRPSVSVSSSSLSLSLSLSNSSYDPKKCQNLIHGHCNDNNDGGAWTYQNKDGNCTYIETSATSNNAPRDSEAVLGLPNLFPNIESVLDFGGGVGVYLTGFRNAGVSKLVTVEPHPFGPCLFAGIQQDTTDWINTPLDKLPNKEYDLVMTIEVAEHVPVNFHPHLLQALAQATKKWLFFSAAHPGQAGEGHIGPSMKTREQWIQEIHNWTSLRYDAEKTKEFHQLCHRMLRRNSAIFQWNTTTTTNVTTSIL